MTVFGSNGVRSLKIAIIHDWLIEAGGAELVLKELCHLYPNADIYTTVFRPDETLDFLNCRKVYVSYLDKLPFIVRYYRFLMPLMFRAVEEFNLAEYDLVISSSHAVAKNIIVAPDQLHICYCHSPMRYAWDMYHEYMSTISKGILSFKVLFARVLLSKIRILDLASSFRVDYFIANSDFVRRRIAKVYRREAAVIYPPCQVDLVTVNENGKFNELVSELSDEYYFTCSRLVSYKRVDLIADTFGTRLKKHKLIIAGDGPGRELIKSKDRKYSNVLYVGRVSDEYKSQLMKNALAFVYAAKEDFGIVPVEAQAHGTPVIALGVGGTAETITGSNEEKPTGILFYEQTVDSIAEAVLQFENIDKTGWGENAKENALNFSREIFRGKFRSFVNEKLEK